MPGSISHDRQYTSTYYTPFRFYAVGGTEFNNLPVIDFSPSESANRNEILVIPYTTSSVSSLKDNDTYSGAGSDVSIDIYGLMDVDTVVDNVRTTNKVWVKLSTVTAKEGQIQSIGPLFAIPYKLSTSSSTVTLNVANSEMNKNGGQPGYIQQTFPKQPWGPTSKLPESSYEGFESDLSEDTISSNNI